MANPLQVQGNLNRVLTHIVVPAFSYLTVTASFMAKSMASLSFDGSFTDQILTATGVVNSPEPYVQAQLSISLLRSQPLSALWLAQVQLDSTIGTVTAYSDSTTFPAVVLANCSIMEVDPGTFDGQDPTTKVTVRGTFYSNSSLWAGI